MSFSQRTCTDSNIFQTHFMDFFHYHAYDQVSISEMMVETYCHPVMCITFHQCFMNILNHFALIISHNRCDSRTCLCQRFSIFIVISLKYFFTCNFQNFFRDISSNCIDHLITPPCIRLKPLQVQWFVLLHRKKQYQSFFHLL